MSPLARFRKAHFLAPSADLRQIEIAVESMYMCHDLVCNDLEATRNDTPPDGFFLEVHQNLLGRVFENVDGMLLCVASRGGVSADALARVVVESSINVMHLCTAERGPSLVGYFDSWLSEHRRKLSEWRAHSNLSEMARLKVVPIIDQRLQLTDSFESILAQLSTDLAVDRSKAKAAWPSSLFRRFEALGRTGDYYSSYHRLSSATHLSAEDTFTWVMVKAALDHELLMRAAKEAVAYTVMMSRIATGFYVDAVSVCLGAYGLHAQVESLRKQSENLQRAAIAIAAEAGVPQ